jgi:hypothetical protein
MRLIVLPSSLDERPVGQGEFALTVSHPLGHLAFVGRTVGQPYVHLLVLGELSEEELAGEGSAIFPGDLAALMRLLLHSSASVSHSFL